ncbi:MAG TPA: hypothetical protein VNO26_15805 [Candidatus Limnocylindria bacterium]|nr:hypothetical protein [Candidatus Limnocylindria bacterium]
MVGFPAVLAGAQLLVLEAWAVVALVLVGIGLLVRRAAGAAARDAGELLDCFWLGWAALLLGLQVWHLARPIDDAARAACLLAGAIGLVAGGLTPWRALARGAVRDAPALAAAVLLAVWVSNHALAGARYGDVAAYFVPTVRWLVEQRIVPGLGNLHAHYALNQSYFGYVAALEAGPFAGRSHHLANGLLALALGLRVALAAWRTLRLGRATGPVDVFYVLVAPGIFALVVSIWLTSPNPDVGVFALGTVVAAELLALAVDAPSRRLVHLRAATLLAVTGVTVKLSFAGFAAGALLVGLGLYLAAERPRARDGARQIAVLTGIGLAAIVPWIVRNVIMSGLPFYPSAVIALPVDWRVGTDVEGWLRNTVYVGGWRAIVRSPMWFAGILRNWGWQAPDVLGPIVVGLAGCGYALAVRLARRLGGLPAPALPIALVVPALASLVFCLVMSPVPRYAGATVWVLAAIGILLAAGERAWRARSPLRPVLLAVAAVATAATLRAGLDPLWLDLRDFEVTSPIRWEPRRLETGGVVNVPLGIEACGAAPLPCTPYPNPALRWRREGDLAAGFMLDPVLHARYRYDPARRVVR